jgi:SAM-dependent methyltransferase
VIHALQYRILQWISPGEPKVASGSAYDNKSKLRILLGDAAVDSLKEKIVLDYGCGEGQDSVEIARDAAEVIGLDIRPKMLQISAARARSEGVGHKCSFVTDTSRQVDAVISMDCFEHFDAPEAALKDMYRLLKPGGRVFISFGYTWYHPYGGHLFSIFPWAHLIFSETSLMRWRSGIRSDGARRFHEVDGGLNQMTIRRFEKLIRQSPFTVEHYELIPIRQFRRFHTRLTREFTTSTIRVILRKG